MSEICNFSCHRKFQLNTNYSKIEEMPSHHSWYNDSLTRTELVGEAAGTTAGNFLWRHARLLEKMD